MNFTSQSEYFPYTERLLWIMQQLRDPDVGCPWDKQQTFASIVPFTIEEVYEVADAIELGDMCEVREELGDLLFQVVFYAQLGKESGDFDFESIAKGIGDKLIRRHPHVFDNESAIDTQTALSRWEQIKQQERAEKGQDNDTSVLANVPSGMAPLLRAEKLQKRCVKVGFDWPELTPLVEKVHEEIDEVMAEVEATDPEQSKVEEEIGDLFFAVVNLARHLQVDPDQALRKANNKFEQRFRGVEKQLQAINISVNDASLEEMEIAWQRQKSSGA